MAFGKISNTSESSTVVNYAGIAPVKVLAINPTKEELEKIYGRTIGNEPQYLGVHTNEDGKEVKTARIDFILQTAEEACGVNIKTKVSFFLRREGKNNKDKTKIQVIDKYGTTAWVTQEEFRNHAIPMYKNGPANIDSNYRFIYNGEEDLVNFIKIFLGIPNVTKFVNGIPAGKIDNPQDAECQLEHIDDYFNGDFSELKEILNIAPNNLIKVMFGVKHTEGGQYQDIYNKGFVSNRSNNYQKLFKEIQDAQGNGKYPNTIFKFETLKKYEVTSTDLTQESPAVDNPFDASELPFG